jgi:hypothetical protein
MDFDIERVYLVDLLNCLKAKENHYVSQPELTKGLFQVANELLKEVSQANSNFRLFVITKLLNVTDLTKTEPIKLIAWVFSKVFSKFPDRWEIVLVHGATSTDKDVDDRALFKLKAYFEKNLGSVEIIIVSNDKFRDLTCHYDKSVKCTFFWATNPPSSWQDCVLQLLTAKSVEL